MEDISDQNERVSKEAPQLLALLKEMKEGLDVVRNKVQALTAKVKENQYPTADGMSYLEAKHLLLLSYCQSIVYYLLRKAKGFSTEGHPVVRSLVEIRLFLEKIRPIDKKLEYQIQKLTKVSASTEEKVVEDKEKAGTTQNTEDDLLRYRPHPDMLPSKPNVAAEDGKGVYKPPMFAPTSMEEDTMSKEEKMALRKEKNTLRRAKQSDYMKELMNELDGKPDELREYGGAGGREVIQYQEKRERRDRQEEELFTRVPLTKMEKKREKHLKKSRNGLLDLSEGFFNEINTLPLEEGGDEGLMSFGNASRGGRGGRNSNKRKRRH